MEASATDLALGSPQAYNRPLNQGGKLMRSLIAVATLALLAVPAHADTMANCGAAWKAKATAATGFSTYGAWSKQCLAKGYLAPAAAKPAAMTAAPAGATGMCGDGTYTMSKTKSGACSSHGGVKKWL